MTNLTTSPAVQRRHVSLYPLTFVNEGSQVIISRPDIEFVCGLLRTRLPVVRRLAARDSLEAVAGWYQAAYGESADPADFVETLLAVHFIRLDGETETPDQPEPKLRWQRLADVVFSAPALCAHALAAGITA